MTMETKNEIFSRYLNEYLTATKEQKLGILTIVCLVTEMHRKAAIRKFRVLQLRDPAHEDGRGRRIYYTPDVTVALKDIWEAGNEVCGELLHPLIAEYITIMKRDQMWNHSDKATEIGLLLIGASKKRLISHAPVRARRTTICMWKNETAM